MSRIWCSGGVGSNSGCWTWLGTIYVSEEIISDEEGVKLKLPGHVVVGGEF